MEIRCGARIRDFGGRRYFYFWHYERDSGRSVRKRTMSAAWIRKGDGRISSVGWPPTTGRQNRNSPGDGRGLRASSRRIPLLRGTRPRSSLDITFSDLLSRPVPLHHRGLVDAREGERPVDPVS